MTGIFTSWKVYVWRWFRPIIEHELGCVCIHTCLWMLDSCLYVYWMWILLWELCLEYSQEAKCEKNVWEKIRSNTNSCIETCILWIYAIEWDSMCKWIVLVEMDEYGCLKTYEWLRITCWWLNWWCLVCLWGIFRFVLSYDKVWNGLVCIWMAKCKFWGCLGCSRSGYDCEDAPMSNPDHFAQ